MFVMLSDIAYCLSLIAAIIAVFGEYMRRRGMSRGQSKANFRSGAGIHKKNVDARPMRGGWRL